MNYIDSDLLPEETLSDWRRRTHPRRPGRIARWLDRAEASCQTPADARNAGTCLRGTPGCPVAHAHTQALPVIIHLGGTGQRKGL